MRDEIRKRRAEMMEHAARHAQRDLYDERFNVLRTPMNRRRIVVALYTSLAILTVCTFYDAPFVSLAMLIIYMGSLIALRQATRSIPDLPEELIDERMRMVRGDTYRLGFIGAMTLTSVYLAAYIINKLLVKVGWTVPITADQLHDQALVLFFAMLAMPSAIYAWREREI